MELMEHQKRGVDFMTSRALGVANFSQMGTGKTAMAIRAMCEVTPSRVLVACPTSLMYNWEKELKVWSTVDYKARVLTGAKEKRLKTLVSATTPFEVVIVNYEALNSIGVELVKFAPELIICDESHQIKNHKAIKSKVIKMIADKAKTRMRWIMTGTPTPNNILDIWSQYDFIRPGYLKLNFYVFRARYADVYTGAGFPMIRGFRNEEELRKLVSMYSYRVLKEECLDLPDKVFQEIEVELTPANKKIYRDMMEHMVAEVGNEIISTNTILVKLLRLQQITSGFIGGEDGEKTIGDEKLAALEELLESLADQKVIVWCRFLHEITTIQKLVSEKLKRKAHILAGEVSSEDRQRIVDEFQTSSTPDVIVANVQVGGTGLTLTAASYAVYFSRTFSLGDASQSEDRMHRIGQTRKVTYYDLVVRGTIDTYILKVIRKKQKMSDQITGDDLKRMMMGEV